MAHSHSHSSVQAPDNSNARRLLWAFIVTAGFMLIEAVGGAYVQNLWDSIPLCRWIPGDTGFV